MSSGRSVTEILQNNTERGEVAEELSAAEALREKLDKVDPTPKLLPLYFNVVKCVLGGTDTDVPCRADEVPSIPKGLQAATVEFRFAQPLILAGTVPYTVKFWVSGLLKFSQKLTFAKNAEIVAIQARVRRVHARASRSWISVESSLGQIGRLSSAVWLPRNR